MRRGSDRSARSRARFGESAAERDFVTALKKKRALDSRPPHSADHERSSRGFGKRGQGARGSVEKRALDSRPPHSADHERTSRGFTERRQGARGSVERPKLQAEGIYGIKH
jgi:hypothetical protein